MLLYVVSECAQAKWQWLIWLAVSILTSYDDVIQIKVNPWPYQMEIFTSPDICAKISWESEHAEIMKNHSHGSIFAAPAQVGCYMKTYECQHCSANVQHFPTKNQVDQISLVGLMLPMWPFLNKGVLWERQNICISMCWLLSNTVSDAAW